MGFTMAYASTGDMKKRYDVRRLGEICRDDNGRDSSDALDSNEILLQALDDASSMIESALMVGGRYTLTDLNELSESQKNMLIRLTCDLAYGLLIQRRGFNKTDQQMMAPGFEQALSMIDNLEQGKWIFATDKAVAAGKPVRTQLSTNVNLVTGPAGAERYFGKLDLNNGRSIS